MKVGLALGGGGVRGMAHTGVLCVLDSARFPIDIIVGSSAGAIAGAMYAAGMTGSEMQAFARQLSFRRWFARDKTGLGLFSTEGIRNILESAIGEDLNIEDLPRRFATVAVDIDSQQEVVFESGPLADAVCASAAYPGLFAPVRIADRMYFDGGVLNPVPFDVARRLGADRVIAVDVGAQESFFSSLDPTGLAHGGVLWQWFYMMSHQRIFRVVERSLGIMAYQLRQQKLRESPPDVIVSPDVHNIGLLDFSLREVCFAAGESAARNALEDLQNLWAWQAPAVRPASGSRIGRWLRNLLRQDKTSAP